MNNISQELYFILLKATLKNLDNIIVITLLHYVYIL